MCTYLARRAATYYLRRVIPAELRPALDGRAEFMPCLRTKDREEAKRLIPDRTKFTDAELDRARSRMVLDGPERPAERQTGAAAAWDEATLAASEESSRELVEQEYRRDDRAPDVESLRDRLNARLTVELDYPEQVMRDLLREEVEARSHVSAVRQARETARLAEALSPPVRLGPVRPAGPAVPLLETFDTYAKEQGIKPRTANKWRMNLATLVRFLGLDDAARTTADDLDRWRESLLTETTKRGALRSARTVKDKYLSALRATLNWAVEKRRLKENVAAQVVVRVPKQAKLRDRDSTLGEARAILSAALRPAEAGTPPRAALAVRWIPWLLAYTGARVNELSQLRGIDVSETDGVWAIRITPEAGTAKANEACLVPLHPHLIEQGFPTVAAAAGEAPIFFGPGKARSAGAVNRHASKVGGRLARWVSALIRRMMGGRTFASGDRNRAA